MAKRLMAMLFLFLATVCSSLNIAEAEPAVPAVYIFGDSTFDVGTNTLLPNSSSRADMQFYGIDSAFSRPTGRFSNGYNAADRIGIMDPKLAMIIIHHLANMCCCHYNAKSN
ncbi:GDSL-like lipase/acylhydrolase [Sesbania bispinosa]|nr:GDSL-like lipase/acylhydrolase [Sesbania bispinosa]